MPILPQRRTGVAVAVLLGKSPDYDANNTTINIAASAAGFFGTRFPSPVTSFLGQYASNAGI